MGVIYVVAEAMKLGFRNGDPDWCNLGQGQPEVGPMDGAPERWSTVELEPQDHAYGHIGGTDEMRQTVADHYNRLYRTGGKTPYTKEHVSVSAGGRLMLARMFAALDAVNVGYQVPDYTAYEDMLDYHRYRISPVCVPTTPDNGFVTSSAELAGIVEREQLGAYLISNPCNPTGQLVQGEELASYLRIARESSCMMIFDEFYSHFIYAGDAPGSGPVSAAEFVEDVDHDPVLVIDGLTKSFRYPGWRLGWAVGPPDVIDVIGRAASAIDGGPSTAVQRAAMHVLEQGRADQETAAVRKVFSRKRNLMVRRLRDMGINCAHPPDGTFYVWADLSGLSAPLNDADAFFRAALQRKVMTVPGRFFNVNPGQFRSDDADYRHWVRFSFGPPEENVGLGLDRLEAMIRER
jgi:aspartate/methionine/tyrosine aminotransferase